ncbi:MAG: sigma-70 family RNA polymerase sigma factor [Gemmataceae bacterium]|nr:sigma-70 family RNA polymerase sigma factor [Gemmataceae bacterium]
MSALASFRPFLRACAASAVPASLRHRLDPSDIVQETLLRAHSREHECRSPETLRAWLLAILRTVAANLRRHHSAACRDHVLLDSPVPDHADAPGDEAADREASAAVRAAVDALSPDQRLVVLLHDFKGRSFDDIPGLSATTARRHHARAHLVLRVRLGSLA